MSWTDELRARVENASPAELPEVTGELARALSRALERAAVTPRVPAVAASAGNGSGMLLNVDEAAARLGVAPSWLYRHAGRLPFSRKLGHKTLRFDQAALERWAASRKAP